jgi:hypothetical protein
MIAGARCPLHDIDLAATGECGECSMSIAGKPAVAVTVFDADEGEYQRWLYSHRRGYVINILRGLNPKEAKLHCADCDSISDPTTPYVTRDYVKVCAGRRAELDEWAIREVGSKIPPCQNCFGF